MALALEQVRFAYASTPVLGSGPDSVSCAFPAGTITAILGPNGAGKTTLVRLGLGVLAPCQGRVTLDGVPVRSIPPRRRAARIAYIAQRPSVSFAFTVGQVVAMGRYHAAASSGAARRDRVAPILDRVGLLDRVDDPVGHLSAGQQQRVALARALVQLQGPDAPADGPPPTRVLLADEPMSAQDPRHQAQTASHLRGLANAGVAVVVVLHDLTLVPQLADRAVLLDGRGSVAADGSVDEVLRAENLGRVYGVGFRRIELGGPRWAMVCDDPIDPPTQAGTIQTQPGNTAGPNDL